MNRILSLVNKLADNHSLELSEYEELIEYRNDESVKLLRDMAVSIRHKIYGNDVYIRGLIEITNICKNDCLYCGIRKSNTNCERYRLSPDEIIACSDEGYELGFRTFVLQGGEDSFFDDNILGGIVREIKARHSDCAITLSMGERSYESYKYLRDCGADRYLLRHETADRDHYMKLHPQSMSYDNRMKCLRELRGLGYQVGCGFMVGSPFQTVKTLARDLKFIEEFKPEMCGIGPFIAHKDTPFRDYPSGTLELTCYLLSIIRLIHPPVLLPSTTALGTINPLGREKGIMSGANVVMPNLSPVSVRKKYELYDNKICTGEESAQCRECLTQRMKSIGYNVVISRGDIYTFTHEASSESASVTL
ncbi:MAG: [Synergistaceae bacterium]|nr:[FeFe] hydrogenase H-cluster radical SAM maturase HydE [Synergistaceae bacterium]